MPSKASGPVSDPVLRSVGGLMEKIDEATLVIPDFQRDFTWEPRRTKELLRSIMSRFPAGTFLLWSTTGSGEDLLGWRVVQGAPEAGAKVTQPREFLLDGQQRLTCLYQTLHGVGDERFYLKLDEFWKGNIQAVRDVPDISFELGIFWIDGDSKDASLYEDENYQYANSYFPLARHNEFDDWLDDYVKYRKDLVDPDSARKTMRKINQSYIQPLSSYQFPVIYLPPSTSLDALCNVFETMNTTAKPLGVFELLTARFYPSQINLREMWEEAKENSSFLSEFEVQPYSVMQALTLRARESAQRSAVMELKKADVDSHWPAVVRGFDRVLDNLRTDCGVLSPNLLPYYMLVVPMAACWEEINALKGPEYSKALSKLRQYFWCTSFTSNFDQGANSQATADYKLLRMWLFDDKADAPEAVSGISITESSILSATTRRKAIFAAVQALTVTSKARDFYTSEALTADRLKKARVESHHIFPKAYLANVDTKTRSSELVLNRALIDPTTNKVISKSRPSEYIGKLRDASPDSLSDIFDSHLIDADEPNDALLQDDYLGFLKARLERVTEQIEVVSGEKVIEDVDWEAWRSGKRNYIKDSV